MSEEPKLHSQLGAECNGKLERIGIVIRGKLRKIGYICSQCYYYEETVAPRQAFTMEIVWKDNHRETTRSYRTLKAAFEDAKWAFEDDLVAGVYIKEAGQR